jgi:hypothetical protein
MKRVIALVICTPVAEERLTGVSLEEQTDSYTDVMMAKEALARVDLEPRLDIDSVLPFCRLMVEHEVPHIQRIACETENGFYRVFVVEHVGDTRGNEWYTNITGLVADISAEAEARRIDLAHDVPEGEVSIEDIVLPSGGGLPEPFDDDRPSSSALRSV